MTSVESVIGRALNSTRLQDTSYINSMYVWIPEAAARMRTRYTLVPKWKDVQMTFHRGRLPSGFAYIDAVSYNNMCVGSSSGKRPMDIPDDGTTRNEIFTSTVNMTQNPVTGNNMFVSELSDTDLIPPIGTCENGEYYFVEGNYITFSVPDVVIRIFYHAIPTDCDGLPLIPDNEPYKEALYWYIRMKIIETGYKDPVFKWGDCDRQFSRFCNMAIEQLLLDDMTEMDRKVENIQGHLFYHTHEHN